MPSTPRTLTLALTAQVGHITLHRSNGNVADDALCDELQSALTHCQNNARCLLLSASGTVFCGGASEKRGALPAAHIASLSIPTVCAVNGDATDAGADLALACDFVYALRTARFVRPFDRYGQALDCDNARVPPRLLLYNRILMLAQMGDTLDAAEATSWGLIAGCFDEHEALMHHATTVATELAATTTTTGARTPTRLLQQRDPTVDTTAPAELRERTKALEQELGEEIEALRDNNPPRPVS